MNTAPPLSHHLVQLANCFNPLLVVVLVALVFTMRRGAPGAAWRELLSAAVGVGATILCVKIIRALHLWQGHPKFPSSHTAFAVSIAISIIWLERRAVWLLVPLLLGYSALIVALHFHNWPEAWSGLALGLVVTVACRRALPVGVEGERAQSSG